MKCQNNTIYTWFVLLLSLLSAGTANAACNTDLNMGNSRIINLATPTDPKDGATKKYTDKFSSYLGKGLATAPDHNNNAIDATNAWTAMSTQNIGTGFSCASSNSSFCTIQFSGAVMINVKLLALVDTTGNACEGDVYLNGAVVELAGLWALGVGFSNTSTTILKVNAGDTIALAGRKGAKCVSGDISIGGFQYARYR